MHFLRPTIASIWHDLGLDRLVRRLLAPLILAVSLGVTFAAWQLWRSDEYWRGRMLFEREAVQVEQAVLERIANIRRLLVIGRAMVDHAADLKRDEWYRFVAALNVEKEFPGIDSLAFISYVLHEERRLFEDEQRAALPDFTIEPSGNRKNYAVITHTDPAADPRLLGVDIAVDPIRRAAADMARDSGLPAITEKMSGPDTTNTAFNGDHLYQFMAIYYGGDIPATMVARRAALRGWIAVGFRPAAMLQRIANEHGLIDFDLFDGMDRSQSRLLFDSQPNQPFDRPDGQKALYVRELGLSIGGHFWSLHLRSTPAFETSTKSGQPETILTIGIVLSLVLAGTVYVLIMGRSWAQGLAERMTEALRISESRYRQVIESTSEGYWELDAQTHTVAVNHALARILRQPSENIMGHSPLEFLDEEGCRIMKERLAQRSSQTQRIYEVGLAVAPGDEQRFMRLAATTLYDTDGKVCGSFAFVTDITAQKLLEQGLRDSRERLHEIVASIPTAMMVTRPENGQILQINQQAAELFGVDVDEVVGQSSVSFYADPGKRQQFVETVRLEGKIENYEVALKRSDGSQWWGLLSARLFRYENSLAMLVVYQDLSTLKKAEAALRQSEERYRGLVESQADMVVRFDPEGRFTFVNDTTCQVFGRPHVALLGSPWMPLVTADTQEVTAAAIRQTLVAPGHRARVENRVLTVMGERWIAWEGYAILGNDGALLEIQAVGRDITARKQQEDELMLAAIVYNSAQDAVMITDANRRIQQVNPAFEVVTGYFPEEVIGHSPRILSSGRHDDSFYESIRHTLSSKGSWQGDIWNRHKSGEIYVASASIVAVHNEAGQLVHFVNVFRDITSRKETEERTWRQANYDALTGLPNRSLFRDRLHQAMAASASSRRMFALIFLDLDGFKAVNDTLGHDVGDRLLQETAERLQDVVQAVDTVSRLAGDEFTVILLGHPTLADITKVAEDILTRLQEPFRLAAVQVHIGASLGIACYPADADTADDLIRLADLAMYRAKSGGKNRYEFARENHCLVTD